MTQPLQSDQHRAHPVQLDLNAPLTVARWRVIGNPIMAIPHWIVLCVMLIASVFLSIIAWFAILFTGNIPRALYSFMAAIYRYQWRVLSFYWFMREPYPAFDFTSSDVDTGTDPAALTIPYPDRLSRGLIFVKWLLLIPHVVALLFVGIANQVVLLIAWFTVLFTGKWPEAMRSFVVGFLRWSTRVNAFFYLMTDKYPPFALKA